LGETLILKQDSTKLRWVLFCWLALAVVFAWIGLDPSRFRGSPEFNQLLGLFGFLLSGACSVRVLFKRPATLTFTPQGFAVGERPPTSWSDVERFFIVTIHGTKLVSYVLTPGARSTLRGKARISAALSLTAAHGQVPGFLDREPEEVRDLLEDWRARFAA
jgi:hypothetical protein